MKARIILMSVALLCSVNAVLAQGRYGADSVNCIRNFQLYRDYTKQNNLMEAYPFWVETMNTCPPTVSENMFIEGARILKYKIDQAKNVPEEQAGFVDSLMNLYEERAAHYPKSRPAAYGFKAVDMMRYKPAEKKAIQETFIKAIDEGREKADVVTMVLALQKTIDLCKENEIPAEEVIEKQICRRSSER